MSLLSFLEARNYKLVEIMHFDEPREAPRVALRVVTPTTCAQLYIWVPPSFVPECLSDQRTQRRTWRPFRPSDAAPDRLSLALEESLYRTDAVGTLRPLTRPSADPRAHLDAFYMDPRENVEAASAVGQATVSALLRQCHRLRYMVRGVPYRLCLFSAPNLCVLMNEAYEVEVYHEAARSEAPYTCSSELSPAADGISMGFNVDFSVVHDKIDTIESEINTLVQRTRRVLIDGHARNFDAFDELSALIQPMRNRNTKLVQLKESLERHYQEYVALLSAWREREVELLAAPVLPPAQAGKRQRERHEQYIKELRDCRATIAQIRDRLVHFRDTLDNALLETDHVYYENNLMLHRILHNFQQLRDATKKSLLH